MQTAIWIGYILIMALLFLFMIFVFMWESSLLFTRAPFVPLPHAVVPKVFEALELKPGSVLYDLGCGDGRIILECARQIPNAEYIGVDKAFVPIWFARFKRWQTKLPIKIVRRNFFKTDVSSATHVFTYLFPGLMDSLLPKLKKELKPGTRLVSCDFKFSQMEPAQVIELDRPLRSLGRRLYIYIF